MVHKCGMKPLVYVSTSLFTCTDPDFRKEWSRGKGESSFCWNLAECSYASPGWRAYFFPHLVGLLDDYGVDGVFNDAGYQSYKEPKPPWSDDVVAFGSEECGGHTDDMRALIYAEVNRRGGIVKLHMGNEQEPEKATLRSTTISGSARVNECGPPSSNGQESPTLCGPVSRFRLPACED